MKIIFTLIPNQWEILYKALSNISQGIILFSLAALFVPGAVGLPKDFSRILASSFLLGGLFLLTIAVIIGKKGK